MLPGSRGEAAGEELRVGPVVRFVVNVGTSARQPAHLATQAERGQAHALLMGAG